MERRYIYAAIIGGGAAGMMCALRAAVNNPDSTVLLLEKADRVGKKLLVTGNGRCNLSHRGAAADSYHGEGSEELINILFKKYSSDVVIRYFNEIGLMTRTDAEGRVYPRSNLASSVLDVLRMRLVDYGVETVCGADIREIRRVRGKYEILGGDVCVTAEKLVIATGGRADHAGRENSSDILSPFGLAVTKTTPSLSPVKADSVLLRSLKGVRANAEVRLLHDGRIIKTECGEVQFTDSALSGICVFNLSRFANRHAGCEIAVSLLPEMSRDAILGELKQRVRINRQGELADIFVGMFHKSIGLALIRTAGLKPATPCKYISFTELNHLTDILSDWRFRTVPRQDFKNAQVTAGGVKLSEIDPRTFESKRHKGLYLIGEALDVDGDCGGYNLQFAWASGMCAGDSL